MTSLPEARIRREPSRWTTRHPIVPRHCTCVDCACKDARCPTCAYPGGFS